MKNKTVIETVYALDAFRIENESNEGTAEDGALAAFEIAGEHLEPDDYFAIVHMDVPRGLTYASGVASVINAIYAYALNTYEPTSGISAAILSVRIKTKSLDIYRFSEIDRNLKDIAKASRELQELGTLKDGIDFAMRYLRRKLDAYERRLLRDIIEFEFDEERTGGISDGVLFVRNCFEKLYNLKEHIGC